MALLCSSSQQHTSMITASTAGRRELSLRQGEPAAGKAAASVRRQLTGEERARRAQTPSPPPAGYLGSGRALRRMFPAGDGDNGAQSPTPTPADHRETPARLAAAGPCVPAAPPGCREERPRDSSAHGESPPRETATRPAPSPAPPCTSPARPRALPPCRCPSLTVRARRLRAARPWHMALRGGPGPGAAALTLRPTLPIPAAAASCPGSSRR